jgi:hypothetical protein
MSDFLSQQTERPVAPSPADMRALAGEFARTFDPLTPGSSMEFQVSEMREGFVCVSIVLPAAMTRAFVHLMGSLHSLVRIIDWKARHRVSEVRATDSAELEQQRRSAENFKSACCRLFDEFTAQGMDRKKAISATNKALKADGNPWASYHLVEDVLRSAGRLRKKPSSSKPKFANGTGSNNNGSQLAARAAEPGTRRK